MLGAEQKAWWKQTMMRSDASWKVWGNEVPLMRILAKNEPVGILITDRILNGDAWDCYNTERNELMAFLRDNDIFNVIVITGDIHAHFAGHVLTDHDIGAAALPAATEFIAAGISSNSVFSFLESATREQPPTLRQLITYDATPFGSSERFVNNANVLFLHGSASALEAAMTHSIDDIEAAKDPTVNPHLRFIDTNAQGYGLVTATASQLTTTLVTINRPLGDVGEAPGIKGTATFTQSKDDIASLEGPVLSGQKPFPFR
jgi:alkaline phosphatase D